jgi:hypothetical protein
MFEYQTKFQAVLYFRVMTSSIFFKVVVRLDEQRRISKDEDTDFTY